MTEVVVGNERGRQQNQIPACAGMTGVVVGNDDAVIGNDRVVVGNGDVVVGIDFFVIPGLIGDLVVCP